ncbi:MAG: 16S rRNA (adenine(1518)-N(6)/adenine(1519)-N(6))-dimethyltransferase RsmA [Bdellovibrionota bacterium]
MRTRRQALGQHFLHHQPTIGKIASLVETELANASARGRQARTLLEVGPGKLALTKPLLSLSESHNLELVLVERDKLLEEGIRDGAPKAQVHFLDAANDAFLELVDTLISRQKTPLFFASNLPYSASSQILANLCYRSNHVAGCVVMVQKELALRMVAGPGTGDRGSLSLLIQSYFDAKIAFDVGPGAFSPPPRVMSSVLRLIPHARPLIADLKSAQGFERFCKQLFSQRRKMIRKLIPADKHALLFPKLDISGTERPETLDLKTLIELYRGVSEN